MSAPVFVVSGVPRSGTSLGMALLQAGGIDLLEDDHRPPDADNPLGYHEHAPVLRLPHAADWLGSASGRAVKVIHALLPALPEGPLYRVILMQRGLRAVVASQDRMLARRGEDRGRLGAERLAEVLAAQLDDVRAWLRASPRIGWMELDYDVLLRDPLPALERLVAFADLRALPGDLAAVIRPELCHADESGSRTAGPAADAAGPFERN